MNDNTLKLNPWLAIWTKPRATIQQIIDTDPEQSVLLIAMLTGISNTISQASGRNAGDHISLVFILILSLIMGPISGIIMLYIDSGVISLTGKWLGGKASPQHIRAAYAWSNVPYVLLLLFYIPVLILLGHEMFTSATPRIDASYFYIMVLILIGIISIVTMIWSLIIFSKSLGQVQGFSAWMGLGNFLIARLLILSAIIIILIPVLLYFLFS